MASAAIKENGFTTEQKGDLAQVMAEALPFGNIQAWAATLLPPGVLISPQLANSANDPPAFARALVEMLDKHGILGEALIDLRRNARNGVLLAGVQAVLRNERLDAANNRQAFSRKVQPLFASGPFGVVYDRLLRAVCAIGLAPKGRPADGEIVGSGFLIGPDQIMTNMHVIEDALMLEANDFHVDPEVELYAFFDYLTPPRPGFDPEPTSCKMVKAVDEWLVCARPPLGFDGEDHAGPFTDVELDYAIVRLSQPIGRQPMRKGGGAPRGWLTLPEGQISLLDERPLFVFQHPQAAEQSWDMGELQGLDHTRSRVRYKISAANGSSGGATINADGKLFALHVAEVQPPERRLNQGVRIDFIVNDLKEQGHGDWPDPGQIGRSPGDYWSLRDDDEVPIIGRKAFREAVLQSTRGVRLADPWAFTCRGRKGSGRGFTIRLLRRLLGPAVPVAHLKPEMLARSAKDIVQLIAAELNIDDGELAPDPLPTEDEPRWWRTTLPQWLRRRLTSSTVTLPAWVIVDRVFEERQQLPWGSGAREVIRAMLDDADPGSGTGSAVPELRWLFVGGPDETFPVPKERKFDELLPDEDTFRNGAYNPLSYDQVSFEQDFVECLQIAWWAREPTQPIPEAMFPGLVKVALRDPAVHPVMAGAGLITDIIKGAK